MMGEFNACEGCAYEWDRNSTVCLDCLKGDKFERYTIKTCEQCRHYGDLQCKYADECRNGSKFEMEEFQGCIGCVHLPPNAQQGGYNCRVNVGCEGRNKYERLDELSMARNEISELEKLLDEAVIQLEESRKHIFRLLSERLYCRGTCFRAGRNRKV